METLFRSHTALLLKHARRFTQNTASTIPVEDIAREAELVLNEMRRRGDIPSGEGVSPEVLLRAVIRHAAGRVKRRRTLIEQIAAGDDLEAVSRDLAFVDGDLPALVGAPNPAQMAAHEAIGRLKGALTPHDALVAALLYDDDLPLEEAGRVLSKPLSAITIARERILFTASELEVGAKAASDGREDATGTEWRLKKLASEAIGPGPAEGHIDDALLRLLRDGDTSDDIADAVVHVALCAECRASLTEGEVQRRSVVVLAIEAPRDKGKDLEKAAAGARAKLVERGQGRWMAVVEPSRAASFKGQLDRDDASIASRVAMTAPVEVPVHVTPSSIRTLTPSVVDVMIGSGTSAAEVSAWAQVSRERKRRPDALLPGWAIFVVLAILGAACVAYFATR